MGSDDTSTNTIFHPISQFNNSDIETPDEIAVSEPSPSTFPNPLQPFQTQIPDEPSLPLLPTLMQPQFSHQ